MYQNQKRSRLLLLVCAVLLAVCAMGCACGEDAPLPSPTPVILGEGACGFTFQVIDLDGNITEYALFSDCEKLDEALLSLELIEGEPGPYGLYVKTVQGIQLDYAVDGHYWILLVDGEMSMVGVSEVELTPGAVYAFQAQ